MEETEGLAGEAVSRFPEHSGGYVQRAEVAMRREDWAGACERWEAVRVGFPAHTSGYERGTVALMNAGRLEEVESVAEEAAGRFPQRPGSYLRRAELAMRREDWSVACERWEAVRVAFPDHTSGYERGTVALMNAGRLEEAESLAEEAVGRFRDRPGSYLRRAELAMRREDWAVACERWEALRGAFPDEASGYVRGAAALRKAGCLDEAEAVVCEAMERFPDRPEGYGQWAELAMRRRDWAMAAERWEEVRRAFPNHASGYVRGAAALRKAGRLEEADALAREAAKRFPATG